MKRIKEKILLMSLLSILSGNTLGCGYESDTNPVEITKINEFDNQIEESLEIIENINNVKVEIVEPVIEEKEEEKVNQVDILFPLYATVTAKENVNIRDKEIDGNILGVLKKGSSLELLEIMENGWYKVKYYENIGYISNVYSYETTSRKMNFELKKVCYSNEDINLCKINFDNEDYESILIPALHGIEIYEEYEGMYLVKYDNQIGYIEKEKLNEFSGTFVIVDISDQELTLYSDNEIILKTPVVTGKPSSPTDQGLFEIYNITYNRNLIGPGYQSYVDIMMKYNGNEGLHDAEYHTNEDGRFHGWREKCEFGGETYLSDGSHGCVNMLHDDVMKVSEYAGLGTKVLVQK